MISTVSDAIEFMKAQLHKPVGFFSFGKKKEPAIAQEILSSLDTNPLTRWAFIQALRAEFLQKTITVEQFSALKKAFCAKASFPKWKEALLQIRPQEQVACHSVFLRYANSLAFPINMSERIVFSHDKNFSSAFGSTFATNKPERIDSEGHILLDATSRCVCFDGKNACTGFALGLGDGAGGHFGDHLQDEHIAKAAHVATKSAVQLLSAYHDPEELVKNLQLVIKAVDKKVQEKGAGEGTTLLGCRVFPDASGYRLIGFNIGDNLLIGWNPSLQTVIPLLSSNLTEAGTALIPGSYRSFEIQIIDTVVPKDTLLFLMSDGVHDTLPFVEEEKSYPNGLNYRSRTIHDPEKIFKDIPPSAAPACFLERVAQKSFEGAEALRLRHQQDQNIQIGDDFSLLLCHLT
ncbi:MAG: protein phosphatase 2C domain-containing protein [Rhabdochlamydiaceae bacterium]|jgi:hypothetical protein